MKTLGVAALLASMTLADSARAQSVTTEAAVNAGYSTEDDVSAIATQLRAFGELKSSIRYYVEAAWGRSSSDDSDAFGAAYPYRNSLRVVEAYGERMFRPGGMLFGVRAGRYRTPFGIYNASDHAYVGFLRAPLIRYGGYFALSNDFLERGADVVIGVPRLTAEVSVGAPADVGTSSRRSDLDTVLHLQGFEGPFIVGASYIRTSPYQSPLFAHGRTEFTGFDVRWMREGVQLRGEWITGRPFDRTTTRGWYADALVHHGSMGPVTAVARVEKLDYIAPAPFDLHSARQTFGTRIRLVEGFSTQINLLHQSGALVKHGSWAFDLGLSYSVRHR